MRLYNRCIKYTCILLIAYDINALSRHQPLPCAVLAAPITEQKPCIPFSELAPLAWKNSTSLPAFSERIRKQKYLEDAALAGMLPQLFIRGRVAKADKRISLQSTFPDRAVDFSVRQLLWSFSGPIQEYHLARTRTRIAQEQELFQKDKLRFGSEQTFLDVYLRIQEKNRIQALNVSSYAIFNLGNTNNEVGLLSATQWSRVQSTFTSDQAIVAQYTNTLNRAIGAFEFEVGEYFPYAHDDEYPCLEIPNGLCTFNPVSVEEYICQALHHRKEMHIKSWEIDQEERKRILAARSYIPTISLTFDVRRNTFGIDVAIGAVNQIDTIKQLNYAVGLQLDWSFDGGASIHEAQSIEAEMIALKFEQLNLAARIKRDVKVAYEELQVLLKEVEAEKARIITAEKQFKLQQNRFKVGQLSEVDAIIAKTEWENAQFQLTQRKITAEKKYSELLFLCGYSPELEPSSHSWST